MFDDALIRQLAQELHQSEKSRTQIEHFSKRFPGMRIAQFGFGGDATHEFLPHNYPPACVAYPGTYDNDTLRGWLNIKSDEQRELATAYLEYLYSPEGQAIAFKNYYRAWDTSAANPEDVARFPTLDLRDIASFGGWDKVQPEHFGDGGIFDQIYTAK